MPERGVLAALRQLVVGTIGDPTIAFLSVAVVGHLMVAGLEVILGRKVEALDVALDVVDISAVGQLVVRINIGTLRILLRAIRSPSDP